MTTATNANQEVLVPEAVSAPPRATDTVRYHYLDNLRALAMLAGVLFHVGFGFNVIVADVWPTANKETSMVFDYWTYFLHTFRMPLFFLIAGFFAHHLMQKKGVAGFVKNRALRITLPFVIFWPLVSAAIIGSFIYAALHMDVETPVIQMIRLAITNPDAMNGQQPPISTAHLWFIYYLSLFCFAAAALAKWAPRSQAFYHWLSNPWVLFLGLPGITCFAIARLFIPHPAPESFVPAPWALAFYGLFFIVGWVYFVHQSLLSHVARVWPYLVVSSSMATLMLMINLPEPVTLETAVQLLQPHPQTPQHLARVAATAVLAWHMTFLSLLVGHRLLNRKNAVLRYVADGSYWVYIMHLPVVFYLQLVFHSVDLPLWVEFSVISSLTLCVGYASYAVLVRYTPIGWLLNGRRKKPI